MNKINYSKTSPEIIQLKQMIEETADMPIRTPADFSYLSGLISGKTGEALSPTTLKRLWGYIEGADVTRPSTLNILAKYIGFKNWNAYIEHLQNEEDTQSRPINSQSVETSTMKTGDKLIIEWLPNRRIIIEYKGRQKWEVIEAEYSKAQKGDTFYCEYFLLNEPLYVDKLVHENGSPVPFVMGTKNGLTKIEKVKD